MLTRFKNSILNIARYFIWKYSDDLVWVLGILFLGFLMYHAYPVDPNAPL